MSSITKGVVLAGGEGKRLWPVTLEIPKPLITIRKTPLINYNLALFEKFGVKDVKVVIRPEHRDDFARWLGEYERTFASMKVEILEEPEPMGTLGYLYHRLRDWMDGENIYVTNGDDIKNVDLAAMVDFHSRVGVPATVALIEDTERTDGGAVLVVEDKISAFMEKFAAGDSKLISAGMYILSSAALDAIRNTELHEKKHLMFETDLFPLLARVGNLGGFIYEGTLYDCGTFERWHRAIREA